MTWNMSRSTEKLKRVRNAHCRTRNIVKNLKNVENEKHTLQDLEYFEKTDKRGK